MMMPVHELAQLTWEEVRDLERDRTLVVLPVGAIEAHGPHLPLDTDVVIATAMARAGAKRLGARDKVVLILPPLAYTTAGFGAAFHGTLSISGVTVTALVVDLARGLSQHGFRLLALANAHLDPEHLTALHEAVRLASGARLLPIVFPDLTRKPWGSRLGDEFRTGACHAGQFESSIVLSERPAAVREALRRAAPIASSAWRAKFAGVAARRGRCTATSPTRRVWPISPRPPRDTQVPSTSWSTTLVWRTVRRS